LLRWFPSSLRLLASLLDAVHALHAQGRWPSQWPAAPIDAHYTGIELMPRDVGRAEAALAGLVRRPQFICGDMRLVPLPACRYAVARFHCAFASPLRKPAKRRQGVIAKASSYS